MRIETDDSRTVLGRLPRLLASDLLPAQEVIAGECKVHQSTVSRARSGVLKRVTPKVRKIYEYALERVGEISEGEGADNPEQIEVEEAPIQAPDLSEQEAKRCGRAAVQGLRRYLREGYDARLVIDQLAVLRRAQKPRAQRMDPVSAGSSARP